MHREFNRLRWIDNRVGEQIEFLCDLINGGEFSLAHKFLQQRPDAAGNSYSSSPIYSAARKGNLELVRNLVEKCHVLPDHPVRRKWPYDIAAERGHIDIMNFLHTLPDGDTLSFSRTREAEKNPDQLIKSTLYFAVRGGHLDVVRMLVEERHHPLTFESKPSRHHASLMTIAIAKQRWSIVEYLQAKGLKLQHKRRALEFAARKNDFKLAEHIIDHHLQHILDPQRRWIRFRGPLRIAARGDLFAGSNEKMFMLLLDRSGHNFDAITNPLVDKKLLIRAAQGNSVVILQKLWDLGCRNTDDPRILSVFHFLPTLDEQASSNSQRNEVTAAVVDWLLDHGANPCVTRNFRPIDIITMAIQRKVPSSAIKLIEGVSNWLKNHPPSSHDQQNPVRKIADEKWELHISQLNQQIAECRDSSLQAAVEAGYIDVVASLLAHGVDFNQYRRYLLFILAFIPFSQKAELSPSNKVHSKMHSKTVISQ